MTEPITVETVRALAAAAGIQVPAEDEEALAAGLAGQLAAIAELEESLDLTDVDPALRLDPRWP